MAFECVQWIRRGGALPESANLLTALTQTTYTFQGDKLLLEPKADLKARIGFSPDEFDALILTFAHPVTVPDYRPRYRHCRWSTIPFANRTRIAFLAALTITIRLLSPGSRRLPVRPWAGTFVVIAILIVIHERI